MLEISPFLPMVKPSIYPRGAIISNLHVVQFPFSFAYVTRRSYVTMFLSQILSREEKVRSPLHFQNRIELARFCNGINTGFNRTITSFFPPKKASDFGQNLGQAPGQVQRNQSLCTHSDATIWKRWLQGLSRHVGAAWSRVGPHGPTATVLFESRNRNNSSKRDIELPKIPVISQKVSYEILYQR